MRKEVLGAIILGLILGAVIVAGYYRADQAKHSRLEPGTPTVTPEVSPNTQLLTITSPADGDIFNTPVATISGTTTPEARIVIVSENDQEIVKPSPNGYFNQEVELDGGTNRIQVSAINPTGDREDRILNLVYTTEINLEDYETNP